MAGYVVAYILGMLCFFNVGGAAVFAAPKVLPFGIEFTVAAVFGVSLMSFNSTI
jgi:NCS2 family nucleobase:cation symporter-2